MAIISFRIREELQEPLDQMATQLRRPGAWIKSWGSDNTLPPTGRFLFMAVTLFASLPAPAGAQAIVSDEGMAIMDIPKAPAEGGSRRWEIVAGSELSVHDAPSSDAPVMKTLGDGTILSNLGCQSAQRSIWCQVESIRGRLRGYALAEYLRPAIAPDGTVATGINDSALRARKGDFDTRSQIRCAQERGQKMGTCTATVARSGGGDAAVVASFSNGFKRTLYFVHGQFISANATMSGSGSDTHWQKQGNLHIIRVDDQRYELPDHLVFDQ